MKKQKQMKKTILLISLIAISQLALSQNGQLPPVNFPSGKNVCDNNPWILVFQDYFNGDQLNTPWITFTSWKGMPGGDNDNWDEARYWGQGTNSIVKDQNIEVSNGTVKLKVKKENTSWQCASCSTGYSANYTSGFLCLPYDRSFNAGKFEASIKMPTFRYAHSTFWTWAGSGWLPGVPGSQGVNEIDIAEGYGQTIGGLWGGFPRVNYSLHAWAPGNNQVTNPYNMQHVEVRNRYPNQTWWNWLTGTGFKIDQFHTYTCEWDTAIIKFFVDGSLISEQWKYYQDRSFTTGWWFWQKTFTYRVGSTCYPTGGTWNVMKGFPYNNNSESNLRFTPYVDQTHSSHSGTLGQMEIDYVKIWQKHPENGWHDLCDPALSTITGPDIICSTATYQAVPPSPSGYWLTPSSNLTVLSSNNASITVQKNATSSTFDGYVYYYPLDPSCPNTGGYFLKWKSMDVGLPTTTAVICSETHNSSANTMKYNLRADPNYFGSPVPISPYNSPTTFEWDIDYGPNFSLHHHVFGQTVSTPTISYTSGTTNSIKWTLKVTNACGTVTKTGQMSYYLMKKAPDDNSDHDRNNLYVVADITDFEAYESAVDARLFQTFIPEEADNVTINSTIEKIAMEELEPYILLDSSDVERFNMERRINPNTYLSTETKVYPNPTNNFVNFSLSEEYKTDETVTIHVYDLLGRLQKQKQVLYTTGDLLNVDISELSAGMYNFEIQQNTKVEHFKILKKEQ